MAGSKRASMREGPLAALFRKTETEGLEDGAEAPARPAAEPSADADAPKIPSPQERLRHAFSSDLPENLMAPPSHEPAAVESTSTRAGTARARSASRSCASSASAVRASTRSTA